MQAKRTPKIPAKPLSQRFKNTAEIMDFLTKPLVIVGFVVTILQLRHDAAKERKDREIEIYSSLDEGYIEWEKLCLKYPHLDVFDVQDTIPAKLDAKQKKEELILFTILFALFERAYVSYSDQSTDLKKRQWSGWREYISDYCGRENFVEAWKTSGTTYESGFQQFMEESIHENKK